MLDVLICTKTLVSSFIFFFPHVLTAVTCGLWNPLDTFRFPFWKLVASLLCNYVVFHIPDALLVPNIFDKREVISVLRLLLICSPR